MKTLSAILILTPFIDEILSGTKTWEIRSSRTNKKGLIGLIRSKSGTVVGTANLVDCIELTPKLAYDNARKMGDEGLTRKDAIGYVGYYAWVLEDVIKFKKPVPYIHGTGPIIWKTLDEPTTKKIIEESKRSR
jgi:hypothetical protein